MNIKKRGELSIEEIVKLILGALVLIAIIVLLAQLVKIAHSNVQAEQANNTMNKLAYEIQQLSEGEAKTFLIESPVNYFIWANESRLCVCPSAYLDQLNDQADVENEKLYAICAESRFCMPSANAFLRESYFGPEFSCYIKTLPNLVGTWATPGNCLKVGKVPLGIKMEKVGGVVQMFPMLNVPQQVRMEEVRAVRDVINKLADGSATIFRLNASLASFKNKGWALYANDPLYSNLICICEKPLDQIYSGLLDKCRNDGLCVYPNSNLAVVMKDNIDTRWKLSYLDIKKEDGSDKEIATIIIQRTGNNVFISSK